ncbi:hypothetical protein VPH35_140156 [Triticum aestivum]|uniref:uncharacterized protein n=1 Tax=Triticum aestivum TaxID=4565 RepID=UPI000843D4D4|nr:uncharacterized protein LOC123166443 [Triticum aestivum]
MSRRRPRGGTQRMDAAIDHFAIMGYRKADVRSVVNRLLRDVYGRDGWPFLEDSCYSVVQDALFEMQEEQDKLQLQAVQQPQEEDGDADGDDGGGDDDDDEEAQQLEAAMMDPPSENAMPIVMVDSEAQPSETVLAVEQTGEVIPMIMDPPARTAGPPHPASTGTGRTRRPCYGWISESESDSDYEEYVARRQKQVHVPAK